MKLDTLRDMTDDELFRRWNVLHAQASAFTHTSGHTPDCSCCETAVEMLSLVLEKTMRAFSKDGPVGEKMHCLSLLEQVTGLAKVSLLASMMETGDLRVEKAVLVGPEGVTDITDRARDILTPQPVDPKDLN